MYILLSNDDGYLAEGLITLAEGLKEMAKISVIAPDKNRSAASNSLTIEMPLRAETMANGFIKVDGTPTDCVHLAITGLLDKEPDMVIAGINHGANLGDDVLYSGTVAAATEGRFLGLPAMAISMDSNDPQYISTGVKVAQIILQRILDKPLTKDILLNINVPDLPWTELKGFQTTRLGQRHKAESVIKSEDPRGRTIYWVGPPGKEQDAGAGTDFYAISQGFVSITPLQLDLTRYDALEMIKDWMPQ
jgi:5'-nucleotidase